MTLPICFHQALIATMGKLLAHEIAHALGALHDGEDNECDSRADANRIMTPTVANDARVWSDCTRKYVEKFVEEGDDFCLFK